MTLIEAIKNRQLGVIENNFIYPGRWLAYRDDKFVVCQSWKRQPLITTDNEEEAVKWLLRQENESTDGGQ